MRGVASDISATQTERSGVRGSRKARAASHISDRRTFFMNYQECRAYIDDSAKYGSVLGLDNMREMLGRLGNPQDDVPLCACSRNKWQRLGNRIFIYHLTRAGYRVGRYISPPYIPTGNVWRWQGERISREKFAGHVARISQVITQMTDAGLNHPTPFEIETAAAFFIF